MPINFRPQGSNGPPYNPSRDIAYLGPTLMRVAFEGLVLEKLPQDFQEFAAANGITQEQLNEAVGCFAEAQADYVSVTDPVQTPAEALERHGFTGFCEPVQLVMYSMLGQALAGAWFHAVRDVTLYNEDSPANPDISQLLFAARTVAGKDPTSAGIPPNEFGVKIIEQKQQLQNRDAKVAELTATIQAREMRHRATVRELQLQIQGLECSVQLRDGIIKYVNKRSLWQLIQDIFKWVVFEPPANSSPTN